MKRILASVFLSILIVGCTGRSKEGPPGIAVRVGLVKNEDVSMFAEALGRLSPNKKAKVIAKVSGEIKQAPIQEGEYVEKGELLFEIDCELYKARVHKARAALTQSKTDLEFSKKKQKRFLTLVEKEYVTQLNLDELEKEVADNEADVISKEAELELAILDYEDCFIKAPISGTLGEQKVSTSNYVDKGTVLTNIVQIDLLDVDFHLPEKYLIALHEARRSKRSIFLKVNSQFDQESTGYLTFVDNEVDPETGTILLRGSIDNENRELEAGQFARVNLELKVLKNATVIPKGAVQIGQQGLYFYLLKDNGTVELTPTEVVYQTKDFTVISNDLPTGAKVVTDGHINLHPGAKVSVKEVEGAS